MGKKSEKLFTVFDEDLVGLLKSIDRWDTLQNGELFCMCCKVLITLKSLQIIIPNNEGGYDFICSNINCITSYKEREV